MAERVVLAFDYGERRIGVAASGGVFGPPTAQKIIKNTDELMGELGELIKEYTPTQLVVGLPHNLDGEETAQSQQCREFAHRLEHYKIPVVLYDETLSSKRAASRLGKSLKRRPQLDAMAAQIILEDYISHATH